MNRWQEIYCKTYYKGKLPMTKVGKEELELLGKVQDEVVVHFPTFVSPIESQCSEAHVEKYIVVEDNGNMSEGTINVAILAGNLKLWTDRGYLIEY